MRSGGTASRYDDRVLVERQTGSDSSQTGELRTESLQRRRLRLNEGLRYRQQTVSVDQKRSHQQAVSMSRRSAHCRRDRMRSVIQLAAPKPPSVTRLAQAAPCQE